jgi:PAS domain-containing protein
LGSRP